MDLGAFSVSLAVSDIARSHEFYERLGFVATGGDADQGWVILRNHHTTIGIFAGMFDRNMLTFNPGLDGATMMFVDEFTDVRSIQSSLEADGISLGDRADPDTSGAASITVEDPDGNPILIDQFDRPDGVTGLASPVIPTPPMPLELGPFTYTLDVADLARSATYYRSLGFVESGRGGDETWITMRHSDARIGLHSDAGGNSLTFDPGLDADSGVALHDAFSTIEEIETVLIGRGLSPDRSVDPSGHHAVAFVDPDGNRVLIRQLA
jgi:catechol 2,3-dioxygenase-like lactoylglutathione lyase family enzyme